MLAPFNSSVDSDKNTSLSSSPPPSSSSSSSLLCCTRANDGRASTTTTATDGGVRVIKHTERAISVDELAAQMETGDLLFMCGHTLLARIIEWFGRTRFSHVCMVDRIDRYDYCDPSLVVDSQFYLWESVYHPDQCRCVVRQRTTNGVRLVEYVDRMVALFDEYDKSVDAVCVAIVKLELKDANAATNVRWRRELGERLHAFQSTAAGRPYQLDVTALIQSRYSGMFGSAPREDRTVFCSELIMLTLIAMGLLPDTTIDTNVSLTALSYDCHRMNLLHGARFRPQIDYYNVQRPRHLSSAYGIPPVPSPLPMDEYYQHQQQSFPASVSSSPSPSYALPLPASSEMPAVVLANAISAAVAAAMPPTPTPTPTTTTTTTTATTTTSANLVRVKKVHLS